MCVYGGFSRYSADWIKYIGVSAKRAVAGAIVQVAKAGKIIHKDDRLLEIATNSLGYNVIDGPALDWLATQYVTAM